MEVLNNTQSRAELAHVGEESNLSDLGGQSLIRTIVSLTELPEPLMHQEMDQIIKASGHQSESLTLEQLRVAMLSYLESIQADFANDDGSIAKDDNSMTENDASLLKTPVILE